MTPKQRASAIASGLFTNGQGQVADRLVLVDKNGRDLGGWCQQAIRDRIADGIREALMEAAGGLRKCASSGPTTE